MSLIVAIFIVLFGLAFGSFLNVCISRLPRHESIIRPPSRCPSCSAPIRAVDNIPALSWALLRGRCRQCKWPIPRRYPLVEFGTAVLFLLSYLTFGWTLQAAGMAVLCFLLFGLAVTDAEALMLPDAFTLTGIVLGILFRGLTSGWRGAEMAFVYALAAGGLLLLIRGTYWLVRRREGMGLGDTKLFALIAAWLGPWQALLVLFLGVTAAAIYGTATRIQKKGAHVIPLGSFLCAGAIYAIFRGEETIRWYLRFYR